MKKIKRWVVTITRLIKAVSKRRGRAWPILKCVLRAVGVQLRSAASKAGSRANRRQLSDVFKALAIGSYALSGLTLTGLGTQHVASPRAVAVLLFVWGSIMLTMMIISTPPQPTRRDKRR